MSSMVGPDFHNNSMSEIKDEKSIMEQLSISMYNLDNIDPYYKLYNQYNVGENKKEVKVMIKKYFNKEEDLGAEATKLIKDEMKKTYHKKIESLNNSNYSNFSKAKLLDNSQSNLNNLSTINVKEDKINSSAINKEYKDLS